jgi:hypothetical protein
METTLITTNSIRDRRLRGFLSPKFHDSVPTTNNGALLRNSRKTERRREIVSGSIGGARRTLCAFEELAQNGAPTRDCFWVDWRCAPHPLRS